MSIFGQIFGSTARPALPEGATVIDVRTPAEFAGGHVEGSINIPLDTVQRELPRLKAITGPIVLVCASGNRSGQATAWLRAQGLDQVENGGSWLNFR
ncbi:MAG TPA: rhodanese-like domain-containing protein [Flavobacteriales bacterium]|nr:rhodanese-like domain-containing protein [Flavobacteriales bacterium]HQW87101.1 rhodanese-like domain-containing protein [Flavobacteriales bacterium]